VRRPPTLGVVPAFSPFPALRYPRRDLTTVAAPPYDVLTDGDRLALEALDPVNSVRLDAPRDEDGRDRYRLAADRLAAWLADGSLVRDAAPSFTIVRMTATDAAGTTTSTIGVIGALTLEPPATGGILPHEETTAKDKSDRLSLIRATRINTSPIWGLSMQPGLSRLIEPTGPADASATDHDGVLHETWQVDDPDRIAAIAGAIAGSPVVIADGHHRFETALAHHAEQGIDDAGAAAIMCLIVELAPDALTVRPIHRQVTSLPASLPDAGALLTALAPWFDVIPARSGTDAASVWSATLPDAGGLGVLTGRGRFLATPRPGVFDAAVDLDSQRLRIALEALGVEVRYLHDADAIAADVADGRAAAGVLLRPATVAQIRSVAERRTRMPAKTTFFWPKPRTGLVFRPLD
jgi:uncharacterized protein (DUF1015 family)